MSRSGTLTYEVVDLLTRAGMGQSTCIGVGGDPIIGTTFVECLREFKNDPQTEAIVICGEIGGSDEEDAAAFIAEHMPEMPIVAFIGGRNAPPGKSLGHAGAIISGNFGTPQSKIAAFQAAGVPVAERPSVPIDPGPAFAERLGGRRTVKSAQRTLAYERLAAGVRLPLRLPKGTRPNPEEMLSAVGHSVKLLWP